MVDLQIKVDRLHLVAILHLLARCSNPMLDGSSGWESDLNLTTQEAWVEFIIDSWVPSVSSVLNFGHLLSYQMLTVNCLCDRVANKAVL